MLCSVLHPTNCIRLDQLLSVFIGLMLEDMEWSWQVEGRSHIFRSRYLSLVFLLRARHWEIEDCSMLHILWKGIWQTKIVNCMKKWTLEKVLNEKEKYADKVTSSQKLGRHASCRVRSVWKSLGWVIFGLEKFRPKFFINNLAELNY